MNRRIWVIFGLFLTLRLLLAFRLPIFNDEAIYMHWGLGFLQDPSRWWAWTLDGKQPLVAISFGIIQRLPFDPLISMRLVSILWSCVTFWGVFSILSSSGLTRGSIYSLKMNTDSRLRENDINYTLLLIALCPFLILFDTLALAESPVTACFTLALYLSLLFSQKPTLAKGILLGAVVATGWWYKSTMLLAVPLVFFTLLINWKQWAATWQVVVSWVICGVLTAFALMVPVLFNPNIDYSKTMTAIVRTRTLMQILATPPDQWFNNAQAIVSWLLAFVGPVAVIVFCIALWQFWKKREVQVLALWIFGPIFIEYMLLTSLTARYLAVSSVPLLLLAALWLSYCKKRVIVYAVIVSVAFEGVLLSFFPLQFYSILKPLPAARLDFSQYVTGWTSGWGVSEAVGYLTRQSAKQPIVVFVRLDSGNPEDAVLSYMTREHIPVFYLEQMKEVAGFGVFNNRPWYFVSRGNQYGGLEKYMTLVAKYKKPLDDEFVGVYRINK